MTPTIHAAVSPTNGSTPATNEKETASGTCARLTVNPHSVSFHARAGVIAADPPQYASIAPR